jgi:hypothetical protein
VTAGIHRPLERRLRHAWWEGFVAGGIVGLLVALVLT